jgi:hypothetical protein
MLDATFLLQQLTENKNDNINTGFYPNYNKGEEKNVNYKKFSMMLTYEINENDLDDNDLGNGLDVQPSYLDGGKEINADGDEQNNY